MVRQSVKSIDDRRSPTASFAIVIYWVAIGLLYYQQPFHRPQWPLIGATFQSLQVPTSAVCKQYAWLSLELLWLMFLGAGSGDLLLRRLGLSLNDGLERLGFSLALGWGFLGTALAMAGLAKLWYPAIIFPALGVWTGVLVVGLRGGPPATQRLSWNVLDRVLATCLVFLAIFNYFAAMMPETFYDALVYHLALPQLYWHNHGMIPTPHNIYSGIPMLAEMLYGLAIRMGGERLAHLVNWTFGVLSAGMAFLFCRRFYGFRAGLIAALIFYSTPLVATLSWKAAVELCWALFQFLSVFSAILALSDLRNQSRWLLLCGAFTGFAMSTKYQAWPFGAIIAGFSVWQLRRNEGLRWRESLRRLAPALMTALTITAIWPLRNAWFYHNPIFPFYQDRIAPHTASVDWRALMIDAHARIWQGILPLLLHPWAELTLPHSDLDALGPFLILGLPLLFIKTPQAPRRLLLPLFAGIWLAWLASTSMPRFFVPVLLLAAVLYAGALEQLGSFARKSVYAFLIFIVVDNFLVSADWFNTYDGHQVVSGQESMISYLSRSHPSYARPYYPAAQFIRENLPPQVKVFVFGDARGYGIDRDFGASTRFNRDALIEYIQASKTPEEIRDRLLHDGWTHILINQAEMASGPPLPLTEAEQTRFYRFSQFLRLIFERKDPPAAGNSQAWCAVAEIQRP